MSYQRTPADRPAGARVRYSGGKAMAGATVMDQARPHQPDRLGQWRQRAALGGASAIVAAGRRAGFPLRDRVLSGLYGLRGTRLEHTHSDAAADRGQG